MKKTTMQLVVVCLTMTFAVLAVQAEENEGWLALAAAQPDTTTDVVKEEAPASDGACCEKAAPLPFHCIEGYSGGAITPLAYLCNAGDPEQFCSKPSVAYSFVNIGSKELQVFSVT